MTRNDPAFYQQLGKRLRQARKRAGIRQNVIAKALGVTPVHLCRLENGERQISLADAHYLCMTYEIDLQELSDAATVAALKEVGG